MALNLKKKMSCLATIWNNRLETGHCICMTIVKGEYTPYNKSVLGSQVQLLYFLSCLSSYS